MAEVRMACCDVCGEAMHGHDERDRRSVAYSKPWGLVLTIGYSENGWGYRRDALNWSGVVCNECFTRAEAVFDATVAFLSGGGRQPVNPFYAVWPTKPQPERRATSLLRSVRAFLPGS